MFSFGMRPLRVAALLAAAVLAPSLAPAAPATIPFGTIKPQFSYQKSTIAVVPFNVSNSSLEIEAIPRIVRNDLTLSGFFDQVADQKAANRQNLIDNTKQGVDFTQWKSMGVQYYLMGQVNESGGQYSVSTILYDVASGRQVMNRVFTESTPRLRLLAHSISDAVIKYTNSVDGPCRTKLLFATEQVPGTKEIAIMDWDGFNAKAITSLGKLATTPSWGANGTEFYFTSYHGNRANVYGMQLVPDAALNFSGGSMWTIAAYGGTNHSPVWSPTARRIAMVLSKDGNSELYTCGRDGSGLSRVTKTSFTEGSPGWSPDGTRLAFTSNDGQGVQIYVGGADGGGRTKVTNQGSWSDGVSFSPDGTRLAFAFRAGNVSDIFTCSADGSNPRRLTQGQGNNESPTWAPDGVHLAFSSNRTGQWQIYVMMDDGSNQRQITTTGRNTLPDWGPIPPTK